MTLVNADTGEAWASLRLAVMERDDWLCVECGDRAIEVDHRWPRRLGGTNDPSNLAAICSECNKRKGGVGHTHLATPADLEAAVPILHRKILALLDELETVGGSALYRDELGPVADTVVALESIASTASTRRSRLLGIAA